MATQQEQKTIWTYLGGFKRGMGFIGIIALLLDAAEYIEMPEDLRLIFMGLIGGAIAGNVVTHLKNGK